MAKALLIGRNHNLAWRLPPLLAKAGFQIDVITSSLLLKYCRFIHNCEWIAEHDSLIPSIQKRLDKSYDWVVITDEQALQEVLDSSLSVEEKLKVLPVQKVGDFRHLGSKIALSKLFAAAGVNTPPFFIAHHFPEAVLRAKELGYPVLVKRDHSSGGSGVFECERPLDFKQIPDEFWQRPLLVQKKIEGVELDVSAIYLKGELVHFDYSRPDRARKRFGPSFLRTYRSLSEVEKEVFEELQQIGNVLGAHGFTNISCIQQADGRRFYFETDMRPNVWVGFSQFLGEDVSRRIQRWFSLKERLRYPVEPVEKKELVIPYFLRLNRWELLCNRYRVWQFIPKGDWKFTLRLLVKFFLI